MPVLIEGQPSALNKPQPIWAMPESKLRSSFGVGDPIYAKGPVGEIDPPGLAERPVNGWLREYFESRLGDGTD